MNAMFVVELWQPNGEIGPDGEIDSGASILAYRIFMSGQLAESNAGVWQEQISSTRGQYLVIRRVDTYQTAADFPEHWDDNTGAIRRIHLPSGESQ